MASDPWVWKYCTLFTMSTVSHTDAHQRPGQTGRVTEAQTSLSLLLLSVVSRESLLFAVWLLGKSTCQTLNLSAAGWFCPPI